MTEIIEINTRQLAAELKQKARELGFDRAGITSAVPIARRDFFRDWLDAGHAGTMNYLHQRFDERTDPSVYLPGAKSVICVAMRYDAPQPLTPSAPPDTLGKIARYAQGDDYHDVIKPRLFALADWIRERAPDAQTRVAVDTAPVMEKELAARAGIGWIGKHTCVLSTQIGSWFFLGEVLTTLELPIDQPALDRCGSCRRCIEACPTGAITQPYQLDARRCISYLTIENRDATLPAEFERSIGEWIYGCDICQQVCPWNDKDGSGEVDSAFQSRFEEGAIEARRVLAWSDEDYRSQLRGSAMKRVKLPILKRNAAVVLANAERKKNPAAAHSQSPD